MIYKVLLLGFICLSSTCYSQTEQETMDWIVSKIQKYGNVDTKDKWSNQRVTEDVIYSSSSGNIALKQMFWGETYIYEFDLKDISSMPKTKSNYLFMDLNTKGNQVKGTSSNKITWTNSIGLSLDWNAEENLYSRFYKAILKLIYYNNLRQKNEAF